MSAMDRFMSDLTVSESAAGGTQSESEFETEGSVSNWASSIFGRPNARVEGQFSAESSFDFVRELSRHAESSHERSVQGTRAANSVAVGEVQRRTHAEGESESAYEATTRTIENPNRCRAVTYIAYQLTKRQTIRFRIKSIRRRPKDPAADTAADPRPLRPNPHVAVLPNGVLATNTDRLEVETVARRSAAASRANLLGDVAGFDRFAIGGLAATRTAERTRTVPLSSDVRQRALLEVDEALVAAGVIDEVGGDVSKRLQAEVAFERTTCLPTQAIVVKGCLDDCVVCEPELERSMELELQRKELENKLLERQIELLDKSQEYRCCPDTDDDGDGDD
jgi:hypothetical protein